MKSPNIFFRTYPPQVVHDYHKWWSPEGPIKEVQFQLPKDLGMGFLKLRGQQEQRVQTKNELGVLKDQKKSQWGWP